MRIAEIGVPERRQPLRHPRAAATGRVLLWEGCRRRDTETDRFERAVARSRCDGHNVAAALVRGGLAWGYERYPRLAELEVAAGTRKGEALGRPGGALNRRRRGRGVEFVIAVRLLLLSLNGWWLPLVGARYGIWTICSSVYFSWLSGSGVSRRGNRAESGIQGPPRAPSPPVPRLRRRSPCEHPRPITAPAIREGEMVLLRYKVNGSCHDQNVHWCKPVAFASLWLRARF